MKIRTIAAIGMALGAQWLAAGPAGASESSPEARGLQIAQETDRRDAGFENSVADATMVLTNRNGDESIRRFRMMTLEQSTDGDKTVVVFDQPADLAGSAVLTHSHALSADDQWLYLPAVRRVKRISSRNKAASFMGSEFAFEDLSAWEVRKYTYRYLRDEAFEGADCFVVENTPAYEDSGYSKQIEWVDRTIFQPRKLEYYDRQGRLLKTMVFSGYRQYLDRHWRPTEQTMENHQTGRVTRVQWEAFRFKTDLAPYDFTPDAITRAR
ncbi:MAG: outer membrane lipoprotein-sorting protein [Rhodocyclaceae bacterium]|nr:outer membrane lipoprotein-sorting protein [Rhodocyclaceae bacterium]